MNHGNRRQNERNNGNDQYRPQNAGQQAQNVQNGAVRPAQQAARINHPQDHLKIVQGVISAFSTNKWISSEAETSLRQKFLHLTKGQDNTRLRIGGEFGYDPHPHALGNINRSYHDDLIMYKYVDGTDKVCDVGGSEVRTYGRYKEVEKDDGSVVRMNWAHLMWSMCPNIDCKDDIRVQDNTKRIERIIREHNLRDLQLQTPTGPIVRNAVSCNHAMMKGELHEGCGCSADFDVYKSVESSYYPGVLSGIIDRMVKSYKRGKSPLAYLSINNYGAKIVSEFSDASSKVRNQLSAISRGFDPVSSFKYVLNGCKNTDGVYESEHTIVIDEKTNMFEVTARVKGNAIPYIHYFPLLLNDESFYVSIDDPDYVALFERMDRCINGDVPLDLFRIRLLLRNRISRKQFESLPLIPQSFMTGTSLSITNPSEYLEMTKVDERISTCAKPSSKDLELSKITEDKLTNIVNEIYSDEKCTKAGDKAVDFVKHKVRRESEYLFLRWLQRQQAGRLGKMHKFVVRQIAGELYIIVTTLGRTFLGFVEERKSLTCMAKVQDVISAYLTLGVKANQTSIMHSMVTEQRNSDDRTVKLFTNQESYIIARLLRKAEEARFAAIVDVKA